MNKMGDDIKVVISQKGTIPVYTQTQTGSSIIAHDDTLTGSGTISSPLGVSDDITGKIETYIFEQAVASNIWEIVHNLDKYPSVSVVDSANNLVSGNVHYLDKNRLTVIFNGAFTGKAYLN